VDHWLLRWRGGLAFLTGSVYYLHLQALPPALWRYYMSVFAFPSSNLATTFGCFRIVIRSGLFWLLPTTLHWLSSLSSGCSVGFCVNWLEYSLHWWVQVALLSSCVRSFSIVIRKGYDLVLMLFRICLRVFYTMGFSKIPLCCVSRIREYYV